MNAGGSGNGNGNVPRWVWNVILAAMALAIAGGAGWITRAEGRFSRLEAAAESVAYSQQRIEAKLDRFFEREWNK